MELPANRLSAALADRYRLIRELGAGGMATVYLAHDIKHDRDVAIKVLHPDLGAALGGERFLSEIRTTARLQHPHILPLLDSGAADGLLYYVMPLVTGETLRARLERERQLPVDDAVLIAREVADALQYAHGLGVIHRDIKPENILLQNGHAVVADFGIALAVQTAGGARMTQTGLSLGTPQYMSPEQAMGERTIDARSDLYALGAVTYEMLVGEAPFTGPSVQAIVARVLTEEPRAIAVQRKSVPANVEHAVMHALEKLPADRFDSAKAFLDALTHPSIAASYPTGARTNAARVGGRWKSIAFASIAIAAASGAYSMWNATRTGAAPRDIGLPPTSPIRMEDAYRNFAVAPDGAFVVYEAKDGESSQLWYRSLVDSTVRAIPGTEGAFGTPRISPDGKRVAFTSGAEMKSVGVAGGSVKAMANAGDPMGGGWLANGQIFFADDDNRVARWISPETGPIRQMPILYCVLPQLLSDGERLLCGGGAEKAASFRRLSDPQTKHFFRRQSQSGNAGSLLLLGSDFRVIDDKYLVYMSIDGTLSATRIENLDSLTVGTSVALVPMVRRTAYAGGGQFDISESGTLVYVPGINAESGRLVQHAINGPAIPLNVESAVHLRFNTSVDGTRLATVVEGIQQQELRIYDLRTGTHETVDSAFYIGGPSWSPDGNRIAYRKTTYDEPTHEQLLLRRLDSPEPPQVLIASDVPRGMQPSSYLAANFLVVGVSYKPGVAMVIDPTVSPIKIDSLPFFNLFLSISPDRKWIAYQNQGAKGIVVQPYPSLDRRYQIDPQGGEPLWRSANELVYFITSSGGNTSRRQSFNRVTMNATSRVPVGPSETLFTDPRFVDMPGWSQSLTTGGDFMYLQTPAENLGYYVRVVPGWVKKMKRAVDAANP